MAAGGKRHGYGTTVTYDDDGAGTGLVTLTAVAKAKFPKMTRKKVNARDLSSTDGYDENLPATGWFETDDMKLTAYFTDAQFAALFTLFGSGAEKYFYCNLSKTSGQTTPPILKMKGFITEAEIMEIDKGSDEPIMAEFTITRTSAKPSFTQGA